MGKTFEIPRRTIALTLPDIYDGAEVIASTDISVESFFSFQRLVDGPDVDAQEHALREFGERMLVSWNLTLDGQELPADADGFMRLPQSVATDIIRAWTKAVSEPDAPLGEPSPGGPSSAAD